MRVVLDTNVVVSALHWGGVPYRVLQLSQVDEIEIVTSPVMLAELADVLGRAHLAPQIALLNMSAAALVGQFHSLRSPFHPAPCPP